MSFSVALVKFQPRSRTFTLASPSQGKGPGNEVGEIPLIWDYFTCFYAEIVVCILSFRKSRHKPNLDSTSKYGFSPIWGKNGGVLSMRLQVILDSRFSPYMRREERRVQGLD